MPESLAIAVPALALVLGLVWFAGQAVRRGAIRGAAPPGREAPLAVLQTIALDPRRRLHLIRCENGRVLVLTGGTRDALVLCPHRPPPQTP